MGVNTSPIFTKHGSIQGLAAPLTAANTAMDGTGTLNEVFVAGDAGAYVQKLKIRALGTNAATVVRVFHVKAGVSRLIEEMGIPSTTANNAAALPPFELPLNFAMGAGEKLSVALGTAVVAGFMITAIGGDYSDA